MTARIIGKAETEVRSWLLKIAGVVAAFVLGTYVLKRCFR
jgi:hypothetical protein